jgi:hypothetical protein
MRAAALARLLLALALLLSAAVLGDGASKGAAKPRKRSVRSRVNLGPDQGAHGGAGKRERAASRARRAAGWSNATLAPPACGAPPRGYDPPQWKREPPPSRRVAMRGWLVCASAAPADAPLFALPAAAWPTKDEAFSAAFKGKFRSLKLSPADGVARLVRARKHKAGLPRCCAGVSLRNAPDASQTGDVDAGDWIPLASFSWDAMPLPGEPPLQQEGEEAAARDASEL